MNGLYKKVFPRCNRRLKHLSRREDLRCLAEAHTDKFGRVAVKAAGTSGQDIKKMMLYGIGGMPMQSHPTREKFAFRKWWKDHGKNNLTEEISGQLIRCSQTTYE